MLESFCFYGTVGDQVQETRPAHLVGFLWRSPSADLIGIVDQPDLAQEWLAAGASV